MNNRINGSVMVVTGPPGMLYPSVQPYVSIITVSNIVDSYKYTPHNSTIVDFGENSAGLIRFYVKDLQPGTMVTIKHAEVLSLLGIFFCVFALIGIQSHTQTHTQSGHIKNYTI